MPLLIFCANLGWMFFNDSVLIDTIRRNRETCGNTCSIIEVSERSPSGRRSNMEPLLQRMSAKAGWLWVEPKNSLSAKYLYGRCANSHSTAERMISSSEEEVGCHPKVATNAEGSATSWGGSPGRRGCISIVGVIERRVAMA